MGIFFNNRIRNFLPVIFLSAAFLLLPQNTHSATTPPLLTATENGGKLYTYDTACKSPALRTKQAFIVPADVNTVDNLYLHFHGEDNPTPEELCAMNSGYGLCGAAAVLAKDNVRTAIILSMENKGTTAQNDKNLTEAERNCMLTEAKEKIDTITGLESSGYTVTAHGIGTNTEIKFLEQGFKAKQSLIFNGCNDARCEKIASFKDSGKVSIYAAAYDDNIKSTTAAYQKFPTKIFALKLPKFTDLSGHVSTMALCYLDSVKGNKCNNNAEVLTIAVPNDYGIGKSCKTNGDCPNNLDCEDSNVDIDGDNEDNDFCVCDTPLNCSEAYGKEYPGHTWTCEDGTGITAANTLHYCKSSEGAVKYPLQSQEKNSGVDGSLADDLMRAYENTPLTESEVLAMIQKPSPKIKIPGLSFSDLAISGKLTGDDEGNTYLDIPYIGEYVKGMYNYLILIVGVVCVARIMVAGFIYTVPDTSGEAKSSALKMITQAVIGLFLAITSYTLLYLFNPELVEFKNLRVVFVRTANMNKYIVRVQENGTVLSSAPGTEGQAPSAIDNNFHHSAAGSNAKLSDQNIKDVAAKVGIDQCLLWAFVNKESGGKLHAIGHDENYNSLRKPVLARQDFIMSGKKYSGKTFPPPASWPKDGYAKLNDYKVDGQRVFNDDEFQPGKPPDYGLDWRFSHGISFMQITIFPVHGPTKDKLGSKINGPNGPEWARSIYGRWYTVSDLLNPDTSLEAALRFITGGGDKLSGCGTMPNAAAAFKCLSVSNPAMFKAIEFYDKCPLSKTMQVTDADRQKYCAGKYRVKGCKVK